MAIRASSHRFWASLFVSSCFPSSGQSPRSCSAVFVDRSLCWSSPSFLGVSLAGTQFVFLQCYVILFQILRLVVNDADRVNLGQSRSALFSGLGRWVEVGICRTYRSRGGRDLWITVGLMFDGGGWLQRMAYFAYLEEILHHSDLLCVFVAMNGKEGSMSRWSHWLVRVYRTESAGIQKMTAKLRGVCDQNQKWCQANKLWHAFNFWICSWGFWGGEGSVVLWALSKFRAKRSPRDVPVSNFCGYSRRSRFIPKLNLSWTCPILICLVQTETDPVRF
jgi:hypothetical protein